MFSSFTFLLVIPNESHLVKWPRRSDLEARLQSVVIHALPATAAAFLAFFLANTLKYKLKLGWGWLPLGPTGLVPLALCQGLFPNTVPCSPYLSCRWFSLQPSLGTETSSKKELAHGHTVRQLGSQDELALPDSSCCIPLVCNVVDVEEDLGVPGATREAGPQEGALPG